MKISFKLGGTREHKVGTISMYLVLTAVYLTLMYAVESVNTPWGIATVFTYLGLTYVSGRTEGFGFGPWILRQTDRVKAQYRARIK